MSKVYNVVQYDENNTLFFSVRNAYISQYEHFHRNYKAITQATNSKVPKDKQQLDELRISSIQFQYFLPTESILECQQEVSNSISKHHLLPLAVRYVSKAGFYYIERPPFKINISYKNSRAYTSSKIVDDLSIWIPWTMTVLPPSFINKYDPSSVKIFYSNQSLKNLKTGYTYSFLPNSYTDAKICWSNSFNTVSSGDKVKDEIAPFDFTYWHSMLFNDYMLGGWNNDLFSRPLSIITKRNSEHYRNRYFDDISLEDYQTKFPLLHKYRETDDYKDLYNSLISIAINKFDMTKQKAIKAISRDSLPSDTHQNNNDYVKFFSFMSLLSLEETLSFYKEILEISDLIKKHTTRESSSSVYYSKDVYNSFVTTFSKILSNSDDYIDESYEENEEVTDFGVPVQYPIVKTITGNNPKYSLEKASLVYKNVRILFILQNLNAKQRTLLSSNDHYYDWNDIFFFFEKEKYDMVSFFKYLNTLKDSEKSIIFIKVDCSNKTYQVCETQDYIDYISNLKSNTLDVLSEVKLTKGNSLYHEAISTVLNQENPELVFNI